MQHMFYKNSKMYACGLVKVFVYETFTDEVIEYLLCKCCLC